MALGEGPPVALHPVAVALVLGVSCATGGEGVESGAVGDDVRVKPGKFGVADEMGEGGAEALPPKAVQVARMLEVRDPPLADGEGRPEDDAGSAVPVAATWREGVGASALLLTLAVDCSVRSEVSVPAAAEGVPPIPRLVDAKAVREGLGSELLVAVEDGVGRAGEGLAAPVSVSDGSVEGDALKSGEGEAPAVPVRGTDAVDRVLRDAVGVAAGVSVARAGEGVAEEDSAGLAVESGGESVGGAVALSTGDGVGED